MADEIRQETWQRIGETDFSVSNYGYVRRESGPHGGRIYTTLKWLPLKEKSMARLVAETFLPNPHHYGCIQHLANPRDHSVWNLMWVPHPLKVDAATHSTSAAHKCVQEFLKAKEIALKVKHERGNGFYKIRKVDDIEEFDDCNAILCVKCHRRDNDWPQRRGFCCECYCRIINNLIKGIWGMGPMLNKEAEEWFAKTDEKTLKRLADIDSGALVRRDIVKERAMKKAREKEKNNGND